MANVTLRLLSSLFTRTTYVDDGERRFRRVQQLLMDLTNRDVRAKVVSLITMDYRLLTNLNDVVQDRVIVRVNGRLHYLLLDLLSLSYVYGRFFHLIYCLKDVRVVNTNNVVERVKLLVLIRAIFMRNGLIRTRMVNTQLLLRMATRSTRAVQNGLTRNYAVRIRLITNVIPINVRQRVLNLITRHAIRSRHFHEEIKSK